MAQMLNVKKRKFGDVTQPCVALVISRALLTFCDQIPIHQHRVNFIYEHVSNLFERIIYCRPAS